MDKKQPSMLSVFLRIFVISMLAVMAFSMIVNNTPVSGDKVQDITVTELYKALNGGNIKSLAVNVEDAIATGEFTNGGKFKSTVFDVNDLVEKAVAKGIPVTRQRTEATWWGWSIIFTLLFIFGPILLLIAAMLWINKRQRQMAMDQTKIGEAARPKERYSDVAGCDEAIKELKEIVDFFDNPTKYTDVGAKVPRGVLLVGPPGNGKTLLAKATAGESNMAFISMDGSKFVEMFVGVGAGRVREMFEKARKSQPCIIFIDELDTVASTRTMRMTHEEYNQTLSSLLTEMDGFSSSDRVVVLAATNRPESLDEAIVRPGRLDRKILIARPDVRSREAILLVHSKGKKLAPDVSLQRVAKGTSGFSGADLAAVMNESAIAAVGKKKPAIDSADLDEAIIKVMMGAASKNFIPDREKAITAYHEGGHALITTLLRNKGSNPVRIVTIIPRGPSGGATWMLPDEDVHIQSKEMMLAQMAVMMGGRAGEMYKFNSESSGASSDFREASRVARAMVCEYGMSDQVGKEVFVSRAAFLNITSDTMNCSEATKQIIDAEVKKLLDEAYELAVKLIKDNQDKLEKIAKSLLEKETLDGREVEAIVEAP